MTDNEIIKALECCINDEAVLCNKCPLKNECDNNPLDDVKARYALDLIKRQQAEIERLQKVNDSFTDIGKLYSEIKAEAIKECLGKIEQMDVSESDEYIMVKKYKFDNLVKEMVGDT
jgi:hypothetical protein